MEKRDLMDICIYGTGAVGGYFGAKFILANDSDIRTSLIARNLGLAAIQSNGLILNTVDGQRLTAHPYAVSDNISAVPSPDLIMICVKEYDLDACIDAIAAIIEEETIVMPLLNGVDIYDRVRAGLPRGIVLPSTVTISVSVAAPGEVTHSGGLGVIMTGADPEHTDFAPTEILETFKSANLPISWLPDPFTAIWEKFIFIAAFGLVTAAYDKTIGQVLADPELAGPVEEIMREIKLIAGERGIGLPANIIAASLDKGRSFPFETKTSLQRDVEQAGKQNELDLFGGAIVRMGHAMNIATPATKTALSKAICNCG